ncbi:MAG: response regulator transcription factor [Chloroflexi bacterium]|nr:response regulator transcription factor [Chloroflexota bacterium]
MRKTRILVVDDEPEMLKLVGANLQARGYEVVSANDGSEALKIAGEQIFDLVILDISMPGPDGFQVCQRVRSFSDVPVLMLSARGQEKDKVKALDMGADDYITKPFGVDELMARVRAALRRGSKSSVGPLPPFKDGQLRVDFSRRSVTVKGKEMKLTPTEYNLLTLLVRNAGKVLTHRSILNNVWGPEYGSETDYLWAYIRRLRRKIEPDPDQPRYILTEPGVGYRFRSAS